MGPFFSSIFFFSSKIAYEVEGFDSDRGCRRIERNIGRRKEGNREIGRERKDLEGV